VTAAQQPAVRAGNGDQVCWTEALQTGWIRPRCRDFPGWRIDGISWSPKGRTILLSAMRQDQELGLLRITSPTPFSSNPRDWAGGRAVVTPTPRAGQGVRAAVFSPGGARIAFVANYRSSAYRVGVAPAGALEELDKKPVLPVEACDVAWRPDGAELAVVQSEPTCVRRIGTIVRVRPATWRTTTTLVFGGQHPSWEPLPVSPGR
jgi:hypothetical protein